MSATTERRLSGHEIVQARTPLPTFALPPDELTPVAARAAFWQYEQARRRTRASDARPLGELIAAVDRVGQDWERSTARHRVELSRRLAVLVIEVNALLEDLGATAATMEWIRGFPDRGVWDPQPVEVSIEDQPVAVSIVLAGLLELGAVDARTRRLAR